MNFQSKVQMVVMKRELWLVCDFLFLAYASA
jgi:hypothetical protein